ncbi:hypothetical protein BpHYR1_030256 [Brachionus plicatilis]|uniref:Uncharacterized protein n=1 Tax=Brachionus plicatilis TaxID=10195 RepID=A0A3M7PCJ4_BRAPC|nr:hypothetical protein BpHYR1_030256 [Brachionus plicatilis]
MQGYDEKYCLRTPYTTLVQAINIIGQKLNPKNRILTLLTHLTYLGRKFLNFLINLFNSFNLIYSKQNKNEFLRTSLHFYSLIRVIFRTNRC